MHTSPIADWSRALMESVRAGAFDVAIVQAHGVDRQLSLAARGIGLGLVSERALAASRHGPHVRRLDVRRDDAAPDALAVRGHPPVGLPPALDRFEAAVEAIKRGAVDYLPKPFTPDQLRHVVAQAAERAAMARRGADLERRLAESSPDVDLDTESPAARAALEIAFRAAGTDAPILLRGESGTGKSVLARALHAQSPRARGPFVVVSCPTLSEELLASELFGHAKGGTLFLDEVGEVSPALQAKLLRFLQDREFERAGETRTRRADVPLVAATASTAPFRITRPSRSQPLIRVCALNRMNWAPDAPPSGARSR